MTSRFEAQRPVDELSEYERQVLYSWSDTHKKSALMLFVLLALSRGPAWSGDIHAFLRTTTAGYLGVDEQSLLRALRRLEALNVLTRIASRPGELVLNARCTRSHVQANASWWHTSARPCRTWTVPPSSHRSGRRGPAIHRAGVIRNSSRPLGVAVSLPATDAHLDRWPR